LAIDGVATERSFLNIEFTIVLPAFDLELDTLPLEAASPFVYVVLNLSFSSLNDFHDTSPALTMSLPTLKVILTLDPYFNFIVSYDVNSWRINSIVF
jgi:hypothetical protein